MSEYAGTASGTHRRGTRWAQRLLGLGTLAAVCVGAAPGVASAAPRNPSDAQLTQAQQAQADAAARVGAITSELERARADAEAAHQGALIALQDYEDKQAAYETARAAADAAAAASAQAAADLVRGRDDVTAFARTSFMQGTTAPGMVALLTSGDPAELVQRAALLDAAGVHRTDVLALLTVLEVQAATTDRAARTAVEGAAGLQAQAAELLAGAQSQEVSARAQADALEAREAEVQADLQQARQTLYGLEGARLAAQQAEDARPPTPSAPPPMPSVPSPARPRSGTPSSGGGSAGAPSASAAQTAISAARSQVGVAYSWGGGGGSGPSYGIAPDTQIFGFDCSGLTQYAYARAGIAIGGTSRDQWWLDRDKQVAPSDLQPGDLLFWGGDPSDYLSITHVAIYIGNGQMIEAPDRGQQVMVSSARTSSPTYFGAVRPSA